MRQHWTLDAGVTFLNHGSFGACPRVVLERQQRLRQRLEQEPVRFFIREVAALMERSRERLADFVGSQASELVFVSNATEGVNAVLRSLVLEPGDSILVTDHGYAACTNAARYVAHKTGARVAVASIPWPGTDPEAVVQAVLGAVDASTKLALLDHVTSRTGMVLPIERLVAGLKERGIDTLVDGAHAPGMVPLDVSAIGAAYYVANCHKWLCAPKGAGFLVVAPTHQAGVVPTVVSHGWSAVGSGRYQAMFDWIGTRDVTPWLCVGDAIEAMAAMHPDGWEGIRRANRALALEARALLTEALGTPPPCADSMVGSLAAVTFAEGGAMAGLGVEHQGAQPVQDALWSHGFEVPILRHPGFDGLICRVSAQLYNTLDEYRRLADALSEFQLSGGPR